MRIHVLHNNKGAILSLGVASIADGGQASFRPRVDQKTCIVEVPDRDQSTLHQYFCDLARDYHVDLSSGVPTLVLKTQKPPPPGKPKRG